MSTPKDLSVKETALWKTISQFLGDLISDNKTIVAKQLVAANETPYTGNFVATDSGNNTLYTIEVRNGLIVSKTAL